MFYFIVYVCGIIHMTFGIYLCNKHLFCALVFLSTLTGQLCMYRRAYFSFFIFDIAMTRGIFNGGRRISLVYAVANRAW